MPARRNALAVERLERRRFFALYGLDPSFADGSAIQIVQPTSTFSPHIPFVHTQADGKVLAGGRTSTLGGRVQRFLASGEPDTTFGGGDGSTDVIDMFAVAGGAVQSDGKILLLGSAPDSTRVARFTPDGLLDTSFDLDGVADIAGFDPDEVSVLGASLAVDSAGRIVVLGEGSIGDSGQTPRLTVLARLNPNGSLDTTFAGDGTTVLDFRGRANVVADADTLPTEVAIADGDKPIVLCQLSKGPDWVAGAIMRFNFNGTFDSTFATGSGSGDGVRIFGFPTGAADELALVDALLVQSEDDKIVVGGAVYDVRLDDPAATIIRFNANGSIDTTFGEAGVARAGMRDERIWDLERDSANRYVGLADGVIFRFTTSGAVDTTFADAGRASLGILETYDFEIDADGKALVGGLGMIFRVAERPDLELTPSGVLIITGEAGDNTISVHPSGASDVLVTRNGVQSTFAAADINRIDVLTDDGNDTVNITFDADYTIDVGGQGANNVTVGNGFLRFRSGFSNDTITAGNGNADIDTGLGDALIQLGDGDHNIVAGDLSNLAGEATIITGAGRDDITGSGSTDSITTGGGAGDSIRAGGGNDTVVTAEGNDTIEAGSGADSILSGAGDDFLVAGDRLDGLEFVGGGAGGNVLRGGDGNDILIGTDNRDSLYGGANKDILVGHAGADLLSGGGGKDKIAGNGGKDRIYGGSGDDQLDGGVHDDRIAAGAGDDKIFGGRGLDNLRGADGNDLFLTFDSLVDTLDGGAGDDTGVSDEVDVLNDVINVALT